MLSQPEVEKRARIGMESIFGRGVEVAVEWADGAMVVTVTNPEIRSAAPSMAGRAPGARPAPGYRADAVDRELRMLGRVPVERLVARARAKGLVTSSGAVDVGRYVAQAVANDEDRVELAEAEILLEFTGERLETFAAQAGLTRDEVVRKLAADRVRTGQGEPPRRERDTDGAGGTVSPMLMTSMERAAALGRIKERLRGRYERGHLEREALRRKKGVEAFLEELAREELEHGPHGAA